MNNTNSPNKIGDLNPPQVNEDEIDLLDLVGVLIKRKKLIIGFTLAAALFILGFSIISLKLPPEKSFLPNEYTPIATIKLSDGGSSGGGLSSMLDSSGLGSLAALAGVSGGGDSSSALAVKLATSNEIIDKLGLKFNLAMVYETTESDYPKTALRKIITKNLKVEPDEESGTIAVSYTDINPSLATEITNYTVELLEEKFALLNQDSNSNQFKLVKQKKEEVEETIELLKAKFLSFQEQNGYLDPEVAVTTFAEKVMEIKTQIISLDAEIDTLTGNGSIKNPLINESLRRKKALQNTLKTLEEKGAYGLPAEKELAEIALEYSSIKAEIELQTTVYKGILQQYEMLKLTDQGTGPTFQIIEPAQVPEIKSGPSRGKLCIIVVMAAFFLSLFIAFLSEFWDNLKADPERMAKLKGTSKK